MNARALVAEALGSLLLACAVIGSGIAAQNLSGGNAALALLANSLATGAALIVLVLLFSRLSGAHFNPAVSFAFAVSGELPWRSFALYIAAQTIGMIAGAWLAHAMFSLPIVQVSAAGRDGYGLAIAEIVATFGLALTIFGCRREQPQAVAYAVGLYIVAAYWFTASTSFANPAITIARSFTDTFAGIAPDSVPLFLAAQFAGAGIAVVAAAYFWPKLKIQTV